MSYDPCQEIRNIGSGKFIDLIVIFIRKVIGIFIVILAILVLAAIFLLMFPIIRVAGDSMYPTLKEGQLLLGCRLFNKKKCKVGKVYIVHLKNEEDGEPYYIVKRLFAVQSWNGSVMYDFRGDNVEVSADSRIYGLFRPSTVEALVLGKYPNLAERRKSNEESN